MPTYGPWLSRDPCLWGERVQSEWSGNSYALQNHAIVCNAGEEGHMVMHQPFQPAYAGTFQVVGKVMNTEDGSGYLPLVFGAFGDDVSGDVDANGNFDAEVVVTSPGSDFWGLRSTGNGNAQVAVSDVYGRFDFREVIPD